MLNATGVLVHTNLGPRAAVAGRGRGGGRRQRHHRRRARPGHRPPRPARRGAMAALLAAVPTAGGVHVVNNCAAALPSSRWPWPGPGDRGRPRRAGRDRRRLPDPRAAGSPPAPGCARSARRTAPTCATTPTRSGPTPASCSRCTRRTSRPRLHLGGPDRRAGRALADRPARRRHRLGAADPHPLLPDEPDAQSTLRAGADLVTASGDKLLGGPQAGLLLGGAELVERLRRHPARPRPPRRQAHAGRAGGHAASVRRRRWPQTLDRRRRPSCGPAADRLADAAAGRARPSTHRGRSAEEGRPSVQLPSAAVSLPESFAAPLRTGTPAVVGRLEGGRCLLDLRTCRAGGRRGTGCCARCWRCTSSPPRVTSTTASRRSCSALTGMEPDRLAEEQRRGLTIDLGFAWTTLRRAASCAFVDVPGHERFVANMLAGVGPVPAVLFVVAADEGWMPQSDEHLAALDALGVRHVLVVISKADLADPAPAIDQVRERFAGCAGRARHRLDRVRAGLVALRRPAAGTRPRRRRSAVGRPLVHRPRRGHRRHRHARRGHHPRRRRTRTRRAARHRPRAAVAGPGRNRGGRGGARRGEPAGCRPSAHRSRRHRAHSRGVAGHGRDRRRAAVRRRAAPQPRTARRFRGCAGLRPATGDCGKAAARASAGLAHRRHRASARPRRAPDRGGRRGARRVSTTAASPRRSAGQGRRTGNRPCPATGMCTRK